MANGHTSKGQTVYVSTSNFILSQGNQRFINQRRTRALRVGEVHDPDANILELRLHCLPARMLEPIVTDEKNVEVQLLPHFVLVEVFLRNRRVDALDVTHDLDPLLKGDDGALVLVLNKRINRHTDNELVAKAFRVLEKIQVSDVEEIIHPTRITDDLLV